MPRRQVQVEPTLFDPPSTRPRWKELPEEVRRQARRQMVKMMRDHLRAGLREGGLSDER